MRLIDRTRPERVARGACATLFGVLTIGVLGLGLIGGSLLRALAATGHQVRGYDRSADTRTTARAGGWQVADSVAEAVTGADLVFLAVPLPAVGDVLSQLRDAGYAGIVSDVTSVKGPVADLVASHLPAARYVGGHPMAGKETSGFTASDPDLFSGCAWALTLEGTAESTSADRTEPERAGAEHAGVAAAKHRVGGVLDDWVTVAEVVTGLRARVVPVTAAEHDAAVARISHLPHLVANAMATAGTGLAGTLAAGSYRDATRVAASAPALVAAMCGGNAAALRDALDRLIADLSQARRWLDASDPIAALTEWLGPGHAVRLGWPRKAGPPEPIELSVGALLALGRDGGWLTDVAADRSRATAQQPVTRPG